LQKHSWYNWRHLDIPEDEWRRRIEKRNAALQASQAEPSDYYVDEGLLQKVNQLFIAPTEEELPGMTVIRN